MMGFSDRRTPALLVALALGVSLGACDDSAKKEAAAREAAAKAEAEEQARALEERRKKREAEEKAAAEAEKKHQEQIAALAVLPEKFPKKLDKACDMMVEAQNEFMNRAYADEPEKLEKWKANPAAQQMIAATCKKGGSVEAAACQAHALEKAPVDFAKSFPELLAACNEKFGAAKGGGVPPA